VVVSSNEYMLSKRLVRSVLTPRIVTSIRLFILSRRSWDRGDSAVVCREDPKTGIERTSQGRIDPASEQNAKSVVGEI
jgi:hypothetical protein